MAFRQSLFTGRVRMLQASVLPVLALGTLVLSSVPAQAQSSSTDSVYAGVGPMGLGAGWRKALTPSVSLRLMAHSGGPRIDVDDIRIQGIHYDTRQRIGPGASLLVDWQPWQTTGWRFTTGLVGARVETGLRGRPNHAGNYYINGTTYTSAQVGTLDGKLRYKPLSVYLGGGWESKPVAQAGWRFVGDLGVLLLSKPDVTLTASNSGGNTALQNDLAAERSDLRKYGAALVGSVGVAYGF